MRRGVQRVLEHRVDRGAPLRDEVGEAVTGDQAAARVQRKRPALEHQRVDRRPRPRVVADQRALTPRLARQAKRAICTVVYSTDGQTATSEPAIIKLKTTPEADDKNDDPEREPLLVWDKTFAIAAAITVGLLFLAVLWPLWLLAKDVLTSDAVTGAAADASARPTTTGS